LFRGALRRGKWKLIRVATLPGKTELFDVEADPGETTNLAEQHPDVVRDLEARLLGYAKQAKMSEWLKSQVDYLGAQSETAFDPDYNLDGGVPQERPVLPGTR
jgi:arylsulfatase A-like enzyme